MNEDTNIWLFPISQEILVTDQIGGVPIDCCNLPDWAEKRLEEATGSKSVLHQFKEHQGKRSWDNAVEFLKKHIEDHPQLKTWKVKYDSWPGRELEEYDDDETEN